VNKTTRRLQGSHLFIAGKAVSLWHGCDRHMSLEERNCPSQFERGEPAVNLARLYDYDHPCEWPFSLIPWALCGAGDRTRTGDILLGSYKTDLRPLMWTPQYAHKSP